MLKRQIADLTEDQLDMGVTILVDQQGIGHYADVEDSIGINNGQHRKLAASQPFIEVAIDY
jgi:hypothetical protein